MAIDDDDAPELEENDEPEVNEGSEEQEAPEAPEEPAVEETPEAKAKREVDEKRAAQKALIDKGRKEQERLRETQKLREERASFEREKADFKKRVAGAEEFAADPFAYWESRGMDPLKEYDRLTDIVLSRGTPDEGTRKALARTEALEKKIKEQEDAQVKSQQEAALRAAGEQLCNYVMKRPTRYEYSSAYREDQVMSGHLAVFRKAAASGENLTDREIADRFETELREHHTGVEERRSAKAAKRKPTVETAKLGKATKPATTTTLTNRDGTLTAAGLPTEDLDAEARRERATAMLKAQRSRRG